MSSIPEEIQENILLRLPVKSNARFKAVCKNWNTLICSPKFVNDHLIRTRKNPRIMIRDANCWEGKDIFYIIDYDSISSASSSSCKCEAVVVRLNYPVSEKNGVINRYYNILGSCDGLLCLDAPRSHTYTPILWNPSTREYNEIIPPPDNLEWPSYGFGYDNKIDDYKLVCIASIEDGADEVNAAYAYTLKSGSWRKVVETIPCADFENPAGLLLNGVLHWQLATVTGKISKSIVAFDISNEKFTNLPFPQEIILRPAHSSCHLGVLGASLCIIWVSLMSKLMCG
ncbi:F-box/kelch-repeat protein At3g06240-like [Papaver somniferum]|uniref:F-box/kelch-repeat protein At3g06240-like n=1 Tax=Papaver somniferum TaxID=3469 RepID=UPI000E6FF85B|nr:F-box/kelch-repeat protein At3g06240-like [Papaver somniferum]